MKNNIIYKLILIFIVSLVSLNKVSAEQFNFDVTEIEIFNKGNLYKGLKRGTITTEDGIKRIKDFFGRLLDWKNIDDLIPKNYSFKN